MCSWRFDSTSNPEDRYIYCLHLFFSLIYRAITLFINFVLIRDKFVLLSRACANSARYHPSIMSHSPKPTTFFRVESDSSRARLRKGKGIIARKRTALSFSRTCPEFREIVENHLDWWSSVPSPLISVYSEMRRAEQEADRRMGDGHNDVVIWEIDTNEARYEVQYRNLRPFAEGCGIYIPECAWNNSRCEWIFLNRIPDAMIVNAWYPPAE